MGTEVIYRNRYVIGYSDVDFMKELKLSTLFSYFQDTASKAVEHLGIGVDVLTDTYSVAWVLLRMRVEIGRIPTLNETVTVETWPHSPGKLEFRRDYRVKAADGSTIILATSSWVIMDVHTREIKKSELISEVYKFPEFTQEYSLDHKFKKLKPFGQLDVAYTKVIGYSDVDFIGHINNTRYIDYIMDCFPVESHRQYSVKAIEVNYIREAFPGDSLVMYRDVSALDSNMVYIEGTNETDGKPGFKAQVEIAPR